MSESQRTDERVLALVVVLGGTAHRSALICAFDQLALTGCTQEPPPSRVALAESLLRLRRRNALTLGGDGFAPLGVDA